MIKFLRPLLLNLSLRMRLNSLSNQRPLPPPQLLLILFPTFCMSHQRRRKRWFLCMRMKYLRITTMNLTKLLSQVLPIHIYLIAKHCPVVATLISLEKSLIKSILRSQDPNGSQNDGQD